LQLIVWIELFNSLKRCQETIKHTQKKEKRKKKKKKKRTQANLEWKVWPSDDTTGRMRNTFLNGVWSSLKKKKKTSRIRDSWFPTFQWSEDSHGLRDVLKSQFDPWNALLQQFLSVFYCYVVAIACVFSCKLFLLCRSISFTFLLKWKAILLCNTNFSH